jgi:hypothetical protein
MALSPMKAMPVDAGRDSMLTVIRGLDAVRA